MWIYRTFGQFITGLLFVLPLLEGDSDLVLTSPLESRGYVDLILDVLNNVERISDHCSNVAARLVGTSEGDDYDSHTLKSLMHHNPSKEYSLMYEECCKEYLTPLAAMEKEA
jgi:hypothetical protein